MMDTIRPLPVISTVQVVHLNRTVENRTLKSKTGHSNRKPDIGIMPEQV